MNWFGLINSTLFNAGIFGIPMLLFSPVMIIYFMVNAIPSTATWAALVSYVTVYSAAPNGFDGFMQWLVPYYHYSTGLTSLLVYLLFKYIGISSNSAAMATNSTDAMYTTGRNSYASWVGTGIWLGAILGSFSILPFTLLGISLLPFTAPFAIWKSID